MQRKLKERGFSPQSVVSEGTKQVGALVTTLKDFKEKVKTRKMGTQLFRSLSSLVILLLKSFRKKRVRKTFIFKMGEETNSLVSEP